MKISCHITPDDHRDFLMFLENPRCIKLNSKISLGWDVVLIGLMASMLVSLFVLFGNAISRSSLAVLVDDVRIFALVVIAIFLLPVGVLWLRTSFRLQRDIKDAVQEGLLDESAVRDGLNIGQVEFDLNEREISVRLALCEETYSWKAFRALEETERCLLLMIHSGSALILPKRFMSGGVTSNDVKSYIVSHIGSKA